MSDITLTIQHSSYEKVKAEGPPEPTNEDGLLLIHPAHYDALIRACERGGCLPYEDEGWTLGCM